LTSNLTEDQPTLDVPLPIQDGGNFSNTKELLSLTREERFLKLLATLMLKIEILESIHKTMESTNNGTLCMLTNGKVNHKKVSSMRNSVSTLREISTLFLNYHQTDTLMFLHTDPCRSKHPTE
jgi:hypothetical protein